MSLLTLEETKQYLKIEDEQKDDDAFIETLISAAEEYLTNATGKTFSENNNLAKLFCKIIISDWYENREYVVYSRFSENIHVIAKSMLAQLRYCSGG